MTDENGSAGRFLRMEEKLDVLMEWRLDVVTRLTAIEASATVAKDLASLRWAGNKLVWFKLGVVASLLMGLAGLATRLFH
jgi:hypothetical protein